MVSDAPMFSRVRAGEVVEFRHEAPAWMAQVLQGVAQARGLPRSQIVNEVLERYCRERLVESTFVQRSVRGNPDAPFPTPGDSE